MADHICARSTTGECIAYPTTAPGGSGGGPAVLTITHAVGEGCRNVKEDVVRIQKALNAVPSVSGGPITNLVVDGICGRNTKNAIAAFQRHQFSWADFRVDPDQITIQRLREFQVSSASEDSPSNPDRMAALARVYSTLPLANQLITTAIRTVDLAHDHVCGRLGNSTSLTRLGQDSFARVDMYFNIGKQTKQVQPTSLLTIRRLFQRMQTAIGRSGPQTKPGTGIFQLDPGDAADIYAFTYRGGYTRKAVSGRPKMSKDDNYSGANLREDAIYICTGLNDMSDPGFVAYNSIHELAHFVGPEKGQAGPVIDHTYRHRSDFWSLAPDKALQNADTYAVFAMDAAGTGLSEGQSIYMPTMIIRAGN